MAGFSDAGGGRAMLQSFEPAGAASDRLEGQPADDGGAGPLVALARPLLDLVGRLSSMRVAPDLEALRARASTGPLTILYAARDREHNNAIVLEELLRDG